MWKILVRGLFTVLLSTTPAAAQMFWDNPGADPWKGTNVEALALFVEKGNIPIYVLDRLYFAYQDHSHNPLCRTRALRDGEDIDMMLSGKDKVLQHVTVQLSNWPPKSPTTVFECRVTDEGHEYSLIYPIVCGNWAFNDRAIHYAPAGRTTGVVNAVTNVTTVASYSSGAGSPGFGGGVFGGMSIGAGGGSTPVSDPTTTIKSGPAPNIGSDELSALALLLTGMLLFMMKYFREMVK